MAWSHFSLYKEHYLAMAPYLINRRRAGGGFPNPRTAAWVWSRVCPSLRCSRRHHTRVVKKTPEPNFAGSIPSAGRAPAPRCRNKATNCDSRKTPLFCRRRSPNRPVHFPTARAAKQVEAHCFRKQTAPQARRPRKDICVWKSSTPGRTFDRNYSRHAISATSRDDGS